jgi:hypothetical protein
MTQRFDVMTGRPYTLRDGTQKTAWTRIGTMFALDRGGFRITFDALPVPQMRDGKLEISAVCFEPKEKDGGNQGGSQGGYPPPKDLDDSIPFAPDR